MTVRLWVARTVSAGLLAAAVATPLAAVATAAPTPAPGAPGAAAPSAPSTSAARAAYDQWYANRAPRLKATRATVEFTKNPQWNWAGIGPVIDAEQNAIATELRTLPGTINRAASHPRLANALRAYQARLTEYSRALNADRAARGTERATWTRSNPAYDRVTDASNALHAICRTL
ncbi:hypothetical protein TPB0596_37380 [Tsukamurella pulmonis]|uniref:Uncharacterized protein n=1 Tax=Tsukamurella pulmonis TaxID=47312 RepID=A0A1H1CH61_9ACTN|nr:hypothetical protein [Tsukamurella pulmonis]KXO89918.1 hypothetical protein AXK56_07155 [Tsukamurella pulmonis]BDD83975.1 hypothetical protein TPB0596_37380 [Tsukamurella pulmonis]SDQ63026.1 hypothetical protein SAMN04489765_1185 [Tsukamurella pulmonis]SUP23768.1 Uncharacterised protein [Tsukamurella pulmonis]